MENFHGILGKNMKYFQRVQLNIDENTNELISNNDKKG
jgi:hypothetical protein